MVRRKRGWFTLSLRTILVGITLLSVLFAWFLHHRRSRLLQRDQILEATAAADIHVHFCDEILGWTLPDPPPQVFGCHLGIGTPEKDRWERLRMIAAPRIETVNVHFQAAAPVLDEATMGWASQARELTLYGPADGYDNVFLDSTPLRKSSGYEWLDRCRGLQSLTLTSNTSVNPLDDIFSLPHLEEALLHLPHDHFCDARISPHKVRRLAVSFPSRTYTDLPPGDYEWLCEANQIEEIVFVPFLSGEKFLAAVGRHQGGADRLVLQNGNIDEAHLAALRGWKKLRHLHIEESDMNDTLLARLCESCPQLETLDVFAEYSSVSVTGLAPLKRLSSLKRLQLSGCNLTDDHAAAIARLHRLEEVSVSYNPITIKGYGLLMTMPRLKQYSFVGTEVLIDELEPSNWPDTSDGFSIKAWASFSR